MNKIGFLFSLYEFNGERITTTSVSGDQMAPVLKEISKIVHEYEAAHGKIVLKTIKVRLGEDKVITDPVKMDSLNTLLSLVTEHYGTPDVIVESSTPNKNLVENLKRVLENPKKTKKLIETLNEVDTRYHGVAQQHGLTWKRGGPDSGDYEGKNHSLYSKGGHWSVQDHRGNEIAKGKSPNTAHKFLSGLTELELPILDKGDILLVGKFKNRKAEITGFDTDDNNQPIAKTTKGDQKIFKPRIAKLMGESQEMVKKTYTIEGTANMIANFERFMSHVQHCAGVGHSTVVGMNVDGDGADRFKVVDPDLPKIEEGDVKDSKGSYERVRYSD